MLMHVLFPQTFKKFLHLDVDFKSVHTAAIIVSASVMFIALLSCGNVAWTTGLIAIIGTVASLGSSIIALFGHWGILDWVVNTLVRLIVLHHYYITNCVFCM